VTTEPAIFRTARVKSGCEWLVPELFRTDGADAATMLEAGMNDA
jgi:hypothetical protein